jgi:hypothetical protein
VTLAKPASEIFIEFLDGIAHYAAAPIFGADNTSAMIEFNATALNLRGRKIRITAVVNGLGLEQELTIL